MLTKPVLTHNLRVSSNRLISPILFTDLSKWFNFKTATSGCLSLCLYTFITPMTFFLYSVWQFQSPKFYSNAIWFLDALFVYIWLHMWLGKTNAFFMDPEDEGKGGVKGPLLMKQQKKGKNHAVFYFTGERARFFLYLWCDCEAQKNALLITTSGSLKMSRSEVESKKKKMT